MKDNNESEYSIENRRKIIGIDLGIKYSYIGIIRNGQVELIQNHSFSSRKFPSIVCFKNNNECLIGL